jgi:myxalamid-type polyketide synthase MxaE and MxaD/epothilone polyketide synthase D
MDAAIASLEPALAGLPDRGFALFGYSMGGLIAYELTRSLEARNGPRPFALMIAACRAPHLPDRRRKLHRLPDAALRRALDRYAGTPPELLEDEELMELVLPRLRADFEVCETYAWRDAGPLATPIAVFGGEADRSVSKQDLDAWRRHTRAGFRLRRFPGGHFFIQQHEAALAASVAEFVTLLAPRAATVCAGGS